MPVLITKPIGAPAAERYMVTQLAPASIRIARVDHHAVAEAIAREWGSANYSFSPGCKRAINLRAPAAAAH